MAEELQLQILVDERLDRPGNAVVLGDIELGEGSVAYGGPDALLRFYRDLILGRALPLTLAMRRIGSVGQVMAIALFLRRDMALRPRAALVVAEAGLAELGPAGWAHLEPDSRAWWAFLEAYLVVPRLSRQEEGKRLRRAVEWLHEYVEGGRLPPIPTPDSGHRVLNVGTDGFVVAETDSGDYRQVWASLFSSGFLRGILFGPGNRVVIAKKSDMVSLDLGTIRQTLSAEGSWELHGTWLWGETSLPRDAVVRLLTYM